MTEELQRSYAHCVEVARSRAKNFYWSFVLLPKHKRLAMCAIYAFMRECDDLADGPRASRGELERWRREMELALKGEGRGSHPVWPALVDTVERFHIPRRYLSEMIDGVESDLTARSIETFDDLYRYCYLVASVVGLTIIHIFGFDSAQALPLAEKCGVAFQLTNILRDVAEDRDEGRIYLPAEELRRFEVQSLDQPSPELTAALESIAARARAYYEESHHLTSMVSKDSRASLWALIEIYRRLLDRIERSGYDVLSRRIRLSRGEKLGILLRARLRA